MSLEPQIMDEARPDVAVSAETLEASKAAKHSSEKKAAEKSERVEKATNLEPQIMDEAQPDVAVSAEALEARKAAKRDAAKRFSEKKAAEKSERVEKANKLINKLKAEKLWEKIGKENQEFLDKLATVSNNSGIASTSTFTTMFGADVKVGSKVTLLQAFERTRKGQNEIDRLVRSKWAQKGIVVKYTRDDKDIFKSTYEVMELPLPQ